MEGYPGLARSTDCAAQWVHGDPEKAFTVPPPCAGISVCLWIITDLIAFVWDLDAARKTALVSWTGAECLVGHYFKPTAEDPPRTRVDAFPTPDELIELQKLTV
jgi:hypothetical protein